MKPEEIKNVIHDINGICYEVDIAYREFYFASGDDALDFAQNAVLAGNESVTLQLIPTRNTYTDEPYDDN